MYFPQQPGVGGQMYFPGADSARPPFGQDWANAGWNGAPRAENIQFDPNQPVPQPPRPNQPNNAGTMPGASSPSGSAAQQIQAWREANQGIHKQRWGGLKAPGKRQQARMQPAQSPPPTTRPPVPSPVLGGAGALQGAPTPPPMMTPAPGPTTRPPVPAPGMGAAPGMSGAPVSQAKPPLYGQGGTDPSMGGAAMQLSAMRPFGKDRQL